MSSPGHQRQRDLHCTFRTSLFGPDYPVCGNGVSEIGETCDDGNAVTSPVHTTPAVRSVMRAVRVSQALVLAAVMALSTQ